MIALPGTGVILTVAHSISLGWQPSLSTVGGAGKGSVFCAAAGAVAGNSAYISMANTSRYFLLNYHSMTILPFFTEISMLIPNSENVTYT